MFLQKFRFRRLLADEAFESGDPSLMRLEQIDRGGVFVEIADRAFLNPDTERVAAAIVALGESMERLADGKSLSDSALEFEALGP